MKRLLLLLIAISTFLPAFSQRISIRSYTVKHELPGDVSLWGADAANAVATSANPQGGTDGVRILIAIRNGSNKTCGNDKSTALMENVSTKTITTRDFTAALGNCVLNPGVYTLCLDFVDEKGNSLSGPACRDFTVARPQQQNDPTISNTSPGTISTPSTTNQPSQPGGSRVPVTTVRGLQLLLPANEATFQLSELTKPMTFRWTPIFPCNPMPCGVKEYAFKIYEIEKDQTLSQAVRVNQPIFEKELKTAQAIWQVPSEYLADREIERRFAWTVEGFDENGKRWGEEIKMQSFVIKPTTARGLQLLLPADETKFNLSDLNKPMTFRWTPIFPCNPMPCGVKEYAFKIYEIEKDQTLSQAVRVNQPIFEKELKTVQAIWQVPSEYLSDREIERRFGWTVEGFDENGKSWGEKIEMRSFRTGGKPEPQAGYVEVYVNGVHGNQTVTTCETKILASHAGGGGNYHLKVIDATINNISCPVQSSACNLPAAIDVASASNSVEITYNNLTGQGVDDQSQPFTANQTLIPGHQYVVIYCLDASPSTGWGGTKYCGSFLYNGCGGSTQNDCKCAGWTNVKLTQGLTVRNNVPCKTTQIGFNTCTPISITAVLGCKNNCAIPSMTQMKITGPAGFTPIIQGVPGSFLPTRVGLYQVKLLGVCGKDTCRCNFEIRVDTCIQGHACHCKKWNKVSATQIGCPTIPVSNIGQHILGCNCNKIRINGGLLCDPCTSSDIGIVVTGPSGLPTTNLLPGGSFQPTGNGTYHVMFNGRCGVDSCAFDFYIDIKNCGHQVSFCDSLKATIAPDAGQGKCCWKINLSHPSNMSSIKGIQFIPLAPNTFSSQALGSAYTGWAYSSNTSTNFTVTKASVPSGQLNGFFKFCLNAMSGPQKIAVNWLNANSAIVCTDTVKANCEVPCVTIKKDSISCNGSNYTINYSFTNNANFPMSNISYTVQTPSGAIVAPPVTNLSTPVSPNQSSGNISIGLSGVNPNTNVCIIMRFRSADSCCWCYDTLCVTTPKCICDKVKAKLTGDKYTCCYALSLSNTYAANYFTQVNFTCLTSGIIFQNFSFNTGWGSLNVSPASQVQVVNNSGFIPFGASNNIGNFCFTGYSTSPQYILVEWIRNGVVVCVDTIKLPCVPPPPAHNDCAQIFNDKLVCLPNGTFKYTFQVRNNSTHAATGFQLNAMTTGLVLTPNNFTIPISPNGGITPPQTVIISGIGPNTPICFDLAIYEHVNNYSWCCHGDTICRTTPPCGDGHNCCPATCDTASVTRFNTSVAFLSNTSSTRLVDFSTNFNGTPITNPAAQQHLASWAWDDITFMDCSSYWNYLMLGNNPAITTKPLTVNFPKCKYSSVGFDLSMFNNYPTGYYTIKIYSCNCVYTYVLQGNAAYYFGIKLPAPAKIDKVEIKHSTGLLVIDNFRFGN